MPTMPTSTAPAATAADAVREYADAVRALYKTDLFDSDLRGLNPKLHKPQFDRHRASLARVAF